MPRYFLDSSALVKRYWEEVASPWVLQLSSVANRLVVARLAHIEVASAIVRRGRRSAGDAAKVSSALAALESDMQSAFQVMEFSDPLLSSALDLIRAHGLRAADAIQLACAMFSGPAAPDFYLVSADAELNAAATAEGLQVENPNLHP